MRYLLLVVFIAGCSVNKDVHDMNDRISVMANKMDATAEAVKKSNLDLDKIADFTNRMELFFDKLEKSGILADNKIDLNKATDSELEAISMDVKKIGEVKPDSILPLPDVKVSLPDPVAQPKRQTLIKRIIAKLKNIWKKKDENAPSNP